jgi:uncharacterized protein YbjT (DUF2867 family)
MKCIVVGGTGLIGSHLVADLLKDDRVENVASVVRSIQPLRKSKLSGLKIDFDVLDRTALPKADVALCALGTTIKKAGSQEAFYKVDHDYIVGFARACKNNGVEKFIVVSALGANAQSRIFYNRVKGETENDLKKLGFKSLAILQPSLLLGKRQESRPVERLGILLSPILNKVMVGPLAKSKPIEATKVAARMKSLALDEEWSGVQTIVNHNI